MIKDRNIAPDAFISPLKIMGGGIMGAGEVFYVYNSNEPVVGNWLQQRIPQDHLFRATAAKADVAIQAALNLCVASRNDYVLVWPSEVDYDLTASLTMSKKSVHLICPAGLGYSVGARSAARLSADATDVPVIKFNANNLEIAGFYFKNYVGKYCIDAQGISGSSWAPHIHHNWFAPTYTSTTGQPVIGSSVNTNSYSYGRIERNKILVISSNATIASLIDIGAGANGCDVCHNDIAVGVGIIATIAINNGSANGNTDFNTFSENAGQIANCVVIPGTTASAKGNLCAVATTRFASGGVAGKSFVQNFDGVENVTLDGSVQS